MAAKGKDGLSMMEGVRKALGAVGDDAKPATIQDYLKEHFDLEMRKDLISKYKSDILSKAGKGKKRKGAKAAAKTTAAKPVSMPQAAPAPKAERNGNSGIQVEDVLAIKALVQRVGSEPLRALIGVFAP